MHKSIIRPQWVKPLRPEQIGLHFAHEIFKCRYLNKHCCILINSLAPGRFEYDSKNVIFNLDLLISIFRFSYDNALRWMPQDLTDDKSTLVQVMAWGRQATNHFLSQCWLSSLSPYGVARPQWVEISLQFISRFSEQEANIGSGNALVPNRQ